MPQTDVTSDSLRRGVRIRMKTRSLSRAVHINKEYDGSFSNEPSEDDDFDGYTLPHEHEFQSVGKVLIELTLERLREWSSCARYDNPVPDCHDWHTKWKKENKGLKRYACDGNPSITSATEADKPSGKQKPLSTSSSHGQRWPHGHKRRRRESRGDDNEPPDWRSFKRRIRNDDPSPRFACPFFKWDPINHDDCFRYKFKRIADVKQHLKRHHRQPTHCDICVEELPNEDALHDHIRAQSCSRREYIPPDGMTPAQERRIVSRVGTRNMSANEQWFEVYEILFPGAPRPQPVYLGDRLSEDVEVLRQFMSQQGHVMIVRELQGGNFQWGSGQELESQRQLQNALFSVFDEFLSRQNVARNEEDEERSSRLDTTSQQGEGSVSQRTESGSVEEEGVSVLDEKLELDDEVVEDEDTPDEET
ncbi:hypothetical protein CEP54_014753 [Fusarium duplospermum]|uniref:C2H2-type domain-containing protein n=1 Tax=Fusarium duplospermum TaxID=1325734 RepID=A0A428NTZ6_9HYPO|nr:hypothetical protein CEP54_014753 [Fusarium duplospermum]